MAAISANGTTLLHNSTSVGILSSISYTEAIAEIDRTGLGDAIHTFEGGIPNITVTATVKGAASIAGKSAGTLAVTFNAGNLTLTSLNASLGSFILLNKTITAPIDGETTSELTFRPAS